MTRPGHVCPNCERVDLRRIFGHLDPSVPLCRCPSETFSYYADHPIKFWVTTKDELDRLSSDGLFDDQ